MQPFPTSNGKWQISTAGGQLPMWTAGGGEIVYQTSDDTFFAAAVKVVGTGLEIGLPVKLFQHRLVHGARERNRWVASRDGQRFLLNAPIDDAGVRTIQVVLNWTAGLKRP